MIVFATVDVALPDKIDLKKLQIWLSKVIINEGKIPGEINYVFCTDNYLHKINLDFLQHDTFTDIITFPTSEDNEIISSDLFISLDRIKDNSKALDIELESEFLRVVVHGILHLIGYNDKTKEQVLLMRKMENDYINKYETC